MQLTMSEIWSIATSLLQGRTDFSTSELSRYANLAYHDVGTKLRFGGHEAVATSSITSGAHRIPLPTDFGYALALSNVSRDVGNRDLYQRDPATFDSLTTERGVPVYYGMYGTWMELWPSSDTDTTLQLRYVTAVPVMVSSASTPVVDDRWHVGIAYKTAELLAAARNDLEQEAVCRARYISYMGSTPSDTAYRQQAKAGMSVSIPRRQ